MLNYVKESKWYILLSIGVFMIFAVFGAVLALTVPGATDMLDAAFGGLSTDMPSWQLAIFLFLNNGIKNLVLAMLGIIFGFTPTLMLSVNGAVFGIATVYVIGKAGILYLIAGILPHGIIELPMLWWSCAIGLRLGHKSLLFFPQRITKKEFFREVKMGAAQFLYIVPLLGLAAIIEAFVTPVILSWV
jgi:stage II sporulation protein M